jgi:hypothetical protein
MVPERTGMAEDLHRSNRSRGKSLIEKQNRDVNHDSSQASMAYSPIYNGISAILLQGASVSTF